MKKVLFALLFLIALAAGPVALAATVPLDTGTATMAYDYANIGCFAKTALATQEMAPTAAVIPAMCASATIPAIWQTFTPALANTYILAANDVNSTYADGTGSAAAMADLSAAYFDTSPRAYSAPMAVVAAWKTGTGQGGITALARCSRPGAVFTTLT